MALWAGMGAAVVGPPMGAAERCAPKDVVKDYGAVLERNVRGGLVDYRALAGPAGDGLRRWLACLQTAALPENPDQRRALLVDAYNASVLQAVVRHGRPRSVLDVKGFFQTETHRLFGQALTLDVLEKQWVRPKAEPRAHFVLVCGAVGCPALEARPFFGSVFEERLEAATLRYLRHPRGARVAPGWLSVSKIFRWYEADFGGPAGVIDFVRARLSAEARAMLGPDPKRRDIEYDWTLNQQ